MGEYNFSRFVDDNDKVSCRKDDLVHIDSFKDRDFFIDDDNIDSIRERYKNGLHFVVGDTHGEYSTLIKLMEKIKFDSQKDHIYFVGDYNSGGNPKYLLQYMSKYYQEDFNKPGYHMIRGNHERELYPTYELRNLPDVIVYKGKTLNYYIAHAGMVDKALEIISEDIKNDTDDVISYALRYEVACYDGPLRQMVWSKSGLYSQRSHYHVWPSEKSLYDAKACIIHGHTPFSQMKKGNYYSYGDKMLLWKKQRIWFAEDLQSFDIDSNVKGRFDEEDSYRGISCVCLEIIDEIAAKADGVLKREEIVKSENFVFAVEYSHNEYKEFDGDLLRIIEASPKMKVIGMDKNERIVVLK